MYGTSISECPRFDPEKFERLRKQRRLSRRAFGERINETRQTLLRWGTGEVSPRARSLRAAAHVLRVRPVDLLRPVDGALTLADLRMNRALTTAEVAARTGFNESRLVYWELAGQLGDGTESPLLLSAYLGIRRCSIEQFALTGWVPDVIAFRLADVFHLKPGDIRAAFASTRARWEAVAKEMRDNECDDVVQAIAHVIAARWAA
ncbi:helix-turn-helix transcriptional regulator [Lentzea sp. NPDC042327]|uniref:helix-turn-helix domain-containing protein n=1 Tax=Lentzea sp. NPDC042327 TaxID=3154801 RepID=UPI0033E4A753